MTLAPYVPIISGAMLPSLELQSIALHVGWAVVLGALVTFLVRPFPKALRLACTGLVILACLIQGEWGPSWWLGLAFQSPSLTLQGIAILYLARMLRLWRSVPVATLDSPAYARWPNALLLLAIVIGWIFALDTFAAFDIHLYALGFTPYAILASLMLAALLKLLSMRSGDTPDFQRYRDLALIVLCAMAVHLVVRLPTGNAWDALIDPWLWLTSQAVLLSRIVKWLVLMARVKNRRLIAWAGVSSDS